MLVRLPRSRLEIRGWTGIQNLCIQISQESNDIGDERANSRGDAVGIRAIEGGGSSCVASGGGDGRLEVVNCYD